MGNEVTDAAQVDKVKQLCTQKDKCDIHPKTVFDNINCPGKIQGVSKNCQQKNGSEGH